MLRAFSLVSIVPGGVDAHQGVTQTKPRGLLGPLAPAMQITVQDAPGSGEEGGMIDWQDLDRFPFGDGRKTATCWSAAEGLKGTEVGKQWVVLDGVGRPRAVLETLELTRRRFDDVDADFAREEGEDDRTLESWRRAHQRYFMRNGGFAPDMALYCERFRLIEILGDGAEEASG